MRNEYERDIDALTEHEDIKDYLEANLKIHTSLVVNQTVKIGLLLENKVISESIIYLEE